MAWDLMLTEIHECLGAKEYGYDNSGKNLGRYMNIARNLDFLVKSFGLYYNDDGTLMTITTDVSKND